MHTVPALLPNFNMEVKHRMVNKLILVTLRLDGSQLSKGMVKELSGSGKLRISKHFYSQMLKTHNQCSVRSVEVAANFSAVWAWRRREEKSHLG